VSGDLAKLAAELRAALRPELESPSGEHVIIPIATPTPARALHRITRAVRTCTRCRLCRTRTNAVPGEGSPTAPVVFVGEAPGADEDRQGRPFVGRAGELLTKMLGAVNIERKDVYIANVLKCRPPKNRDPSADEQVECRRYLDAQIAAIAPRFIVTLGRVPTHLLLETSRGILSIRGTPHPFRYEGGEATLIPMLHPAYLLRNERAKREAWEDLKLLHGLLREHTGDWPAPLE
jgi:DNA polymerase